MNKCIDLVDEQIKMTVIIPVYNCEKYIRSAVESVLRQSYSNIEIVLINDGSTDSSPDICNELAREYKCVEVIHQKNYGVSRARNVGIEYAKNNNPKGYIIFLDADDELDACFISDDITTLLSQKYDMLGFLTARCNENLNRYKKIKYLQEGDLIGGKDAVWCHSSQCFCAMMYSVPFLGEKNIMFMENVKNNEDRIFMVQCAYWATKIKLNNKIMHLYRNNPHSTSHIIKKAIEKYPCLIEAWIDLDMELNKDLDEEKFFEGRKMAATYILDMMDEHFMSGKSKKELEKFMSENEYMLNILQMNQIQSVKSIADRCEYIKVNYGRYIRKNKLKGALLGMLKKTFIMTCKIPMMKLLVEYIRYPYKRM